MQGVAAAVAGVRVSIHPPGLHRESTWRCGEEIAGRPRPGPNNAEEEASISAPLQYAYYERDRRRE
jgi:hypothetical protein